MLVAVALARICYVCDRHIHTESDRQTLRRTSLREQIQAMTKKKRLSKQACSTSSAAAQRAVVGVVGGGGAAAAAASTLPRFWVVFHGVLVVS